MIEAIRNIGEYALYRNKKNINEPLNILIDTPANKNTKGVMFITLDNHEGAFKYRGIEIEEYTKEKLEKYLYRKGTSRGTDVIPTSMVTKIGGTFNTKIFNWFKNYKKKNNATDEMLYDIFSCIEKNKEKILSELKEKSTTENNVISLKINGKYLGDYDVFRNILVRSSKENFYNKFNKTSKSSNQSCSVCKMIKEDVFGFVSTFNFYTVDKPGFVSSGFRQENAWKNFPVCWGCALTLEEGRKYLRDNLNFNFYGFKYLLIPKFVKGVKEEIQKDIFKKIEFQKQPQFRKREIKRLTSDENEILELMSEQENYLNVNFLFYSAPKGFDGSVFNILLYIEDILPSRLKKLFEVKNVIDREQLFKNPMILVSKEKSKKEGESPLEFNFGIVQTFFPKVSNNRTFNKYFLEIVNKIFTGKPINYDFLLNFIVRKIREDFAKGDNKENNTLKAFMLLLYLSELELLNIKQEENYKMEELIIPNEISGEMHKKIKPFFDRFSAFFDSSAKRAIFLEGVLAQFLLNIQYQERKAVPFREKLKGLKLDERQIKKLLPEIQNKLEEYGKNYYRELETIISYYFTISGNNWGISNDEISFYFTLGMNLANLFKKEKEDGGNENE